MQKLRVIPQKQNISATSVCFSLAGILAHGHPWQNSLGNEADSVPRRKVHGLGDNASRLLYAKLMGTIILLLKTVFVEREMRV